MKGYILFIVLLMSVSQGYAQKGQPVERPKLVVGIVVDQMRWDYLYRYSARYGSDGFKRILKDGFSCENTMIDYLPSYTAPGHSCIYTGSVPSIHGIAGNDWVDNGTGRSVYCTDDADAHLVGGGDAISASMSPRNLLATTVTDELRLATNMASRVYGVAIKDRGSILPAGHMANAAYWLDDSTGNFCTSSYYAAELPKWLQTFNSKHVADNFIKQKWSLLYPANTYTQSLPDNNPYEKGFKEDKNGPVFDHTMSLLAGKEKYKELKASPYGNTLTLQMAKACLDGERLGQGANTDFLCISLSSTDYVGHQYAPNSMEVEDTYLRLDKDLAELLKQLDDAVGKGNYMLFLTADHGGAHNPQFLIDRKVPAGFITSDMQKELKSYLKGEFGTDSMVSHFMDYQIYFNDDVIQRNKLDEVKVRSSIVGWLSKRPEVAYAIDMKHPADVAVPQPILNMAVNGYNSKRSGSIEVIPEPGWFEGYARTGTTHGTWNPYDTHIPLLWYGWHIPAGASNKTMHMTDIAATVAALLHLQMPNGCIGTPITEVIK